MSAYICNPEHFGVLAAYAVQKSCIIYNWEAGSTTTPAGKIANAQNVARLLARENIRSVTHRYPDSEDGHRAGPCLKDADIEEAAAIYAAHFIAKPQRLTPVQVLSLCQCYDYQACECKDWRTTDAELQTERIRNAAIRDLPGYDEADWSFDKQIPEIEALYNEES